MMLGFFTRMWRLQVEFLRLDHPNNNIHNLCVSLCLSLCVSLSVYVSLSVSLSLSVCLCVTYGLTGAGG